MQSFKELQGEIRKPLSVINAKKKKKTVECERLEMSSRKPREYFLQKIGTIKDRNDKDLTETEKIKKRWQEYTEELYKKKIFLTQKTMMVSITHLELQSLECEVKWALGSNITNKVSGGDGITAELFQTIVQLHSSYMLAK